MSLTDWLGLVTPLSILCGGLFAFFKWRDQRLRELEEKRFDQYWMLVDASQDGKYAAKQRIALLLLKKFPEYSDETVSFLSEAKKQPSGWAQGYQNEIDAVVEYFERKRVPS
jgi:hypothetical protein